MEIRKDYYAIDEVCLDIGSILEHKTSDLLIDIQIQYKYGRLPTTGELDVYGCQWSTEEPLYYALNEASQRILKGKIDVAIKDICSWHFHLTEKNKHYYTLV